MRHRWIGLSCSLAIGAAISACGSSTAPKATATQLMAAQIDTQAVNAAAAQQFDRFRLLAYPIAAMSQNVTPASVSLLVDGVAEPYQALAVEVVGTTTGLSAEVTPSDSFIVVVTWTGTDVSELVYSQVLQPGGPLEPFATSNVIDWADLSDTIANTYIDTTQTSASNAAIATASGGCSNYSLPDLNEAVISLLQGSKCTSGTANVSYSLYFVPNPPTNPHSSFVLAQTVIPALRLVLPASTGGQERMRQLRARLSNRRLTP